MHCLKLIAVLCGFTLAVTGASLADPHDYSGDQTPLVFSGKSSPIRKETVFYGSEYRPGTVIVNTAERRLYYVLDGGRAIKYGIGVGRDGFQWSGNHKVTNKQEWPD